jgi:hypothetical protein
VYNPHNFHHQMSRKGHKGSSREKSTAYTRSSSKSNSMNKRFESELLNEVDSGYEEEIDEEEIQELMATKELTAKIFVWEFGQNDPKRYFFLFHFHTHSLKFLSDSGSKMCRFGMAKRLKVGGAYHGIVLSSEASQFLSPADHDIINEYGIAGINCSWNRSQLFFCVFLSFSVFRTVDWTRFLFTH